ncbi:MAG TPA: hypothetical protein VMX16_03555 [Terriglobia bacterium]|nr:hypothetical protein [Terriglobia bacterium]
MHFTCKRTRTATGDTVWVITEADRRYSSENVPLPQRDNPFYPKEC